MNNPIVFILVLPVITSVGGLALGGLLATLLRRESPKTASLLLSFTAGLMLCIISFDMVPDAVSAAPSLVLTPACLIGGFLVTLLLNVWIDKNAHHSDHAHPHACACGHHDLHTAGVILAAAVALHNMPIGMTIGSTVASHGISYASAMAAVTIGLHNIPEGMSIAIPFLHDGSKAASAIAVSAVSGLPTILGALIGYFIGTAAPAALSVVLSLAAGAMLYAVFFELLPEAYRQWRSIWSILFTVVGFALGLLLLLSHGHAH